MPSVPSRLMNAVRHLNVVNATADEMSRNIERTSEHKIQCKKGCYGCCHMLIGSTVIEALQIVLHFSTDPARLNTLRAKLPEIKRQADLVQDPEMSSTHWFSSAIPCIFLDKSDGSCTIYDVRPVACRTMLVASEPEFCYPRKDKVHKIARFDVSRFDKWSYDTLEKTSRELGLRHNFVAPFPIALLWAIILMRDGPEGFQARIAGTPHADPGSNARHWAGLFERSSSTYEDVLGEQKRVVGIRCVICGSISHNPNDIEKRYCPVCHHHHKDR